MEGKVSGGGGCCIARYGHHGPTQHGYFSPYDESKIQHIMLRFRPIAPKPAVGEPNNKPTSPARKGKRRNKTTGAGGVGGAKRRKKSRSPSDDDNHNNNKSKSSSSSSSASTSNGCKVTLPLLPETPDLSPRKTYSHVGQGEPMWLYFGPSDEEDRTVGDGPGSSVIVEGVTDTWMDGNSLGRTNEERKRRLDEDTCPGFISDGWNRVWWTNKAYRRMVSGSGEDEDTCVMVKLGMREKVELPAVKLFPAFTCRVRVKQNNGTHTHSMTVPCDAWGMDGGGFAWRLDVKAALSLGR